MYLYESKVGKKFQTVIPMQVREAVGIQEGDCYLIESSPYVDLLSSLFQKIENSSLIAVTSILTMTEILVNPYKSRDYKLIEEYRTTLLHFPNLTFRDMDFNIANKAAACRAEYGLRIPDAIQLATAICEEADVFITNDHDFKNVDFPIVFL